ncbi:MAG: hypothetical protein OEU09_00190 [Rhodospirillales bacterium]|nr:hypothetical protein [Rhodospirillales bacterium]MDH3791995.1 hypothetical protein [Rhodospirillales bacterium]MDH3909680.1 hypothetical protein [Rhodospirillales bacterium]MDH3920746.1 hypothetical protein [Rhodospirillales bacterium]MDH3965763.1 hypothetical protein [Rhodospirillales bacterium]
MPISAQDICGMLGECLDVTYSVEPAAGFAASPPEDFTLHLKVKNIAHSQTSGPFIEFHDLEVKVTEVSDGETSYAKLKSGRSEELFQVTPKVLVEGATGSVDVPMHAVGGKAGGKVPIAKVTVAAGFTPARLDMCKVRSKTFEMDHEITESADEAMAG